MIAYSSLASGFLSGKYRSREPLPKTACAGGGRDVRLHLAAAGDADDGPVACAEFGGDGRADPAGGSDDESDGTHGGILHEGANELARSIR